MRLRLFATPRILDATDSLTLNEKSRPFGSVTGSAPDSAVIDDLIIDINVDSFGPLKIVPPLFGGHASTGSNEIYYYLQDYPATTASAETGTDGNMVVSYLQLSVDTPSTRISQSLSVPDGIGGVSGSFDTPKIYTILSSSIEYVSGGGGAGWEDYSRLRIYQDEESMNAPGEITRAFATPATASHQYITGSGFSPFSGSGLIVDILFSGSLSGALFPVNVGANMHTVPITESWYRYEPGSTLTGAGVAEFTLQIVDLDS